MKGSIFIPSLARNPKLVRVVRPCLHFLGGQKPPGNTLGLLYFRASIAERALKMVILDRKFP